LDYNLGTAFARQGEFDQAIEVLEETAERPGHELPDALLEDAYYNLGVARNLKVEKLEGGQDQLPLADAHRETRKALEAFRRALMVDPADADARHNYAVTYRRLKELEASMEQPPSPQPGQDEPSPSQEPPSPDGPDDGMQGDDARPSPAPDGDPDQSDSGHEPEAGDSSEGDSPEPSTPDEADPQASDDPGERDEPAPEASRQQSGLEDAPGPSPSPSPTPAPASQGANGRAGDAEAPGAADGADSPELTQEQLDALRVLNALEQDRPDQFRRMFRFRGDTGKQLERDW
jgi:tetratricopeptide (TPR) repeat protein